MYIELKKKYNAIAQKSFFILYRDFCFWKKVLLLKNDFYIVHFIYETQNFSAKIYFLFWCGQES